MLGLTATDVGRPITRLKLKIEVVGLEKMMLDVISEVRSRQYRVKNSEGEWCERRLTPYRTADNRVDGVVLSVLSFDKPDGDESQPAHEVASVKSHAKKNNKKVGRGK